MAQFQANESHHGPQRQFDKSKSSRQHQTQSEDGVRTVEGSSNPFDHRLKERCGSRSKVLFWLHFHPGVLVIYRENCKKLNLSKILAINLADLIFLPLAVFSAHWLNQYYADNRRTACSWRRRRPLWSASSSLDMLNSFTIMPTPNQPQHRSCIKAYTFFSIRKYI